MVDEYIKYLNTIFNLFVLKNIVLSPKKSYLGYPSIELLGFYVNGFGLSITKERFQAFKNLVFLNNLNALKQYISSTSFLQYLISYYTQLVEPLRTHKITLLNEGRKIGKVEIGKPAR